MVSILGANSVSGGYEVSNSVRFDKGSSPDLTRTFSNNSNKKTWTWSGWFKNCIGANEVNLLRYSPDDNTIDNIVISSSGNIQFQIRRAPTNHAYLNTNQVLRDPSAWYHLVVVLDTTQSTDSNRVKFYLNGNQITSFANSIYPDQNHEGAINSNVEHTICKFRETGGAGTRYGDFHLAENHFIDGTAKSPTDFGEFDDNGVWIPKEYTGSYGSNGYYLEFKQTGTSQNSSGIGADTSGNDNHFTPTNLAATDITEDTCTNNFATMNPLESDRQQGGAATFAEGNLQITTSYVDSDYQRYPQVYSTQAASSGKWYVEMKPISGNAFTLGVFSPEDYPSDSTNNPYGGYATTSCIYSYRTDISDGRVRQNDNSTSPFPSFGTSDVIGCALDMDNFKVYFHKNGTYINSGNPTSGSTGTGAFTLATTGSNGANITLYGFTCGDDAPALNGTMSMNFGNPSFAISSGNTDGKYGNFEYAPPSGYYALCTKRLAEFG